MAERRYRKKSVRGWRRDQRGLGLVEVLVAIGLLGICGAIFVGALSSGSISTRVMEEEVIAQNLAQSQIEQLKTAPYNAAGIGYTAISTPDGYTLQIETDSTLYSNNQIQKLRVSVLHDGQTVLTLEDYKVNR